MSGLITRRSVLQVMTLPLVGCAAEGARYVPNSIEGAKNTGIIYVYRPLTQLGQRGEDPFVSMAHKSYGRMRAGSFVAGTFPEGEEEGGEPVRRLDHAVVCGLAVKQFQALPGDRDTKNLYERAGITARLIVVSRRIV